MRMQKLLHISVPCTVKIERAVKDKGRSWDGSLIRSAFEVYRELRKGLKGLVEER